MDDVKRKILLVEDDMFIRDIYKTKFVQEGFEVSIAENGLEAMKKLEGGIIPDVMLLDIIMPYMDGMEVLKKVKESDDWKNIPIIMLTNISEKDRLNESMEKGIDGYLIKSHFTPSEVVTKVRSILEK
jgi:DNA-binding response OmpR family regulator